MAGTGNEPLFGDGSPGDPTRGQGPVAAVGDTFAAQTDTPGPQGVTPGLTDWMAGTGNEPLFGDGSPGDPTRGQGPPNATDTPTDTQSLINVVQPTPYEVTVVDPATGEPDTTAPGATTITGEPGLGTPPPAPDTQADTESLINVIQPTPLDVHVVDPATGQPVDPSGGAPAASSSDAVAGVPAAPNGDAVAGVSAVPSGDVAGSSQRQRPPDQRPPRGRRPWRPASPPRSRAPGRQR